MKKKSSTTESSTTKQSKHEKTFRVRFITASSEDQNQRLDNYLFRILKGVPKTKIYRIIRKGEVKVNKKKVPCSYKLEINDTIRIPPVRCNEKDKNQYINTKQINLIEKSIFFENNQLIVINKPSGIPVHGGSGIKDGVIETLRKSRPNETSLELIHRIDLGTSGCLMIAKKRSTLRHIHKQFREKNINKKYLALVSGHWPKRKTIINASLEKNVLHSGERIVKVSENGKPAKTYFQLLEIFQFKNKKYSLIEASPLTGRTHQIRVHCQKAGYPIIGDTKYNLQNIDKTLSNCRLFLHAHFLTINMIDESQLKLHAPLTKDFDDLILQLRTENNRKKCLNE